MKRFIEITFQQCVGIDFKRGIDSNPGYKWFIFFMKGVLTPQLTRVFQQWLSCKPKRILDTPNINEGFVVHSANALFKIPRTINTVPLPSSDIPGAGGAFPGLPACRLFPHLLIGQHHPTVEHGRQLGRYWDQRHWLPQELLQPCKQQSHAAGVLFNPLTASFYKVADSTDKHLFIGPATLTTGYLKHTALLTVIVLYIVCLCFVKQYWPTSVLHTDTGCMY